MGKSLRELLKKNNIPEKLINDVIESGYDCGRQGISGESWEVIIDKMYGNKMFSSSFKPEDFIKHLKGEYKYQSSPVIL